MSNSTPPTREQLVTALHAKGAITRGTNPDAQSVADSIKHFGLESVIVPGVRPPISFAAAYLKVFGGRL